MAELKDRTQRCDESDVWGGEAKRQCNQHGDGDLAKPAFCNPSRQVIYASHKRINLRLANIIMPHRTLVETRIYSDGAHCDSGRVAGQIVVGYMECCIERHCPKEHQPFPCEYALMAAAVAPRNDIRDNNELQDRWNKSSEEDSTSKHWDINEEH
eukprot:CAMPEP_0171609214 /NCGR_PEP_ID=MMETSP0990-20121206/9358_1 /TAXON_ID=483369 /ORGANISM="non described non described, Strain CCMP2098" /LENGTH=154 /DNA_ID=CAMNT_0012172465 /DNA_START=539 /DNA_END=1003 /DNA_ORIENTATION=+